MANKNESLQMLTWQTRRLFQQLNLTSGDLLKDLGINPSQRAVLEFLSLEEKYTVPDIARQYDVSRQHIQQVVNELLDKGLLKTCNNPGHKRSVLIQQTPSGRALLETFRRREARIFKQMSPHFTLNNLLSTLETLDKLTELLRSEHRKITHQHTP